LLIPLRSDEPTEKLPIMTVLLIIANVVVFIYQQFSLVEYHRNLAAIYGAIPYELTHLVDLQPRSLYPFYISILTHMFLHGGYLHIIGNMLYFYAFAANVESIVGHFKFLIFYLLCGVVAAVVYIIPNFNSQVPMIGASGAIAGVMGAHLRAWPGGRIRCLLLIFPVTLRAFWVLIPWILLQIYNVINQEQSNVAFIAHIGGFVFGMLAVGVFRERWIFGRNTSY
jgi:membrane associated rhomboid family serine protease